MKKLYFLLLAVMLLTACGQTKENDREAAYMNITAEEAKQIMDSEDGYIILDARTQEEYDQGHIPGAIVRKIGVMAYLPKPDESVTGFITMSREEYSRFVEETISMVLARIRALVEK